MNYHATGYQERDPDAADLEWKAARARKTMADAALAELEVAKACGDLVARRDVAAAWGAALVGLRAKLLAIPTKAGAQIAAETSKKRVEEYLEIQIREALDELASYRPDTDPTGQSIRAEADSPFDEADVQGTPKQQKRRGPRGPYKTKSNLGSAPRAAAPPPPVKRGPGRPRKNP